MISATRIFKFLGRGVLLTATFLSSTSALADIRIGGNVYGGGNEAPLTGSTEVVLRGGNIYGDVYGGAQKANVGGHAYVHIDGANAGDDILVKAVYGGNDVSGSIGTESTASTLAAPFTTQAETTASTAQWSGTKKVFTGYNAFVRSTSPGTGTGAKSIFVGNLFGGGNGDYDYTSEKIGGEDNPFYGLSAPTLAKTYIELCGGTFGYVYGGGNKATVTASTDIYIENPDAPTTISADDVVKMGLHPSSYTITGTGATATATFAQTIDRVFGGNNLADMAIRPQWYLIQGRINNLYSGGNKGAMTSPNGILLNIFQNSAAPFDRLQVNNVYGGCRMADVIPMSGTTPVPTPGPTAETDFGIDFEAGYAARVYIGGGKINNVYGGNDVSGKVAFGTNVEIRGAISGDVYGGGNGSYTYTDNAALATAAPDEWGDYYYDADGGTDLTNPAGSAAASLAALYNKRPHVENTLVHISGTPDNQVYVVGGVYCGGNSATLHGTSGAATAEFKIGQHVTMNGLFLGSNGENMIKSDVLKQYNGNVTVGSDTYTFSQFKLNANDTYDVTGVGNGLNAFDAYLKGVEVNILPTITWETKGDGTSALDYTTYIGSLFCGGNVGSMTASGTFELDMPDDLIIYDKVVGGCNAANVAATADNTFHLGGVTTEATSGEPKIRLNVDAQFEPRELLFTINPTTHFIDDDRPLALNWDDVTVTIEDGTSKRMFRGANIYGGCYTSGYINGGVEININTPLIRFTDIASATNSAEWNSAENRWDKLTTPVALNYASDNTLENTCHYPLSSALAVYGGGYGEDTEIWGDVRINMEDNGTFAKVYGGGEMGVVGQIERNADGTYKTETDGKLKVTQAYGAVINLDASLEPETDRFNASRIYGGGFQGIVTGNTVVYLGGGRINEAIAGACNADIYGHTELYIGRDADNSRTGNFVADFSPVKKYDGSNFGGNLYGGNDFGGTIWGTNDYSVTDATNGVSTTAVRSNTYVEYISGLVANSVYGGACGNYNYAKLAAYPCLDTDKDGDLDAADTFDYPDLWTPVSGGSGKNVNTFVNIASTISDADEAQLGYNTHHGAFFGGGKGFLNLKGIVDATDTYVLAHATNSRDEYLAGEIYGGGYYSLVGDALVDAYSGFYDNIYGGTFGATTNANSTTHMDPAINYACASTTVNVYPALTANDKVAVFGGGANAGSTAATVNLLGGSVGNVYGGCDKEGVVTTALVNVPENSTVSANALFGGAKGFDDALPCDVLATTLTFASSTAYVRSGYLYGGNHDNRATQQSTINISVPVRTSATGAYADVFGAGYGTNTVAFQTHVNLTDGAKVQNVYGGGRDGVVWNQYDILATMSSDASDYYDTSLSPANPYAHWTSAKNTAGVYPPLTQVIIEPTATVTASVYGGGLGEDATVGGGTYVKNQGTVAADIFGGGYGGNVREMASGDLGYPASPAEQPLATTTVDMLGGSVRQIYGGGFQGHVGTGTGTRSDGAYDASTIISIGTREGTTFAEGVPAIERSVYGGGYAGQVFGATHVTLNNGYVGYHYDGLDSDDKPIYTPALKISSTDASNLLAQNGNIFGGGFGEGAVVETSNVTTYGGTVRGSLYGGGEISAVGWGTVKDNAEHTEKVLDQFNRAGHTHVTMYGGLVEGDVFGGGRGFSYNINGVMETGTKLYTDGYVFGTTDVRVHRGTVGTERSVLEINGAHGNVFGGGNVGYVYAPSVNYVKSGTNHHIYASSLAGDYERSYAADDLTEDCRVVVEAWGMATGDVTVNGTAYHAGDYIPNADLNTLDNTETAIWSKIDQSGITIRNAVFAGGNVSKGSDKVYAFANTVFGNATASVIDVYNRDLVAVGGNGIGGLYGDGNLTFVDGYRELNITNYGTDFYQLPTTLNNLDDPTSTDYLKYMALTDRQREFYTNRYKCIDGAHTTSGYAQADVIMSDIYEDILDAIRNDATLTDDERDAKLDAEKACWQLLGAIVNEGRYINTLQRADYCGIRGSRLVLKGAIDRAMDASKPDYTNYTINRVGELSLNQYALNGGNHASYFGIYNVVNQLGALTSDEDFNTAVRTTKSAEAGDAPQSATETWYEWKAGHATKNNRNEGTAQNKVALASGIFLELVKGYDTNGEKIYGPITGVVQLDLLNVAPGEGGGYVYAKNIHGNRSGDATTVPNLAAANANLATSSGFTYDNTQNAMQTSGNFVSAKRIIDDCYPGNGDLTSPGHFWYIRGDFYVYEQLISAYTGSADSYSTEITIPLTITAKSNAKLRLMDVLPGLYTSPSAVAFGDSITIAYESTDKIFHQNDPISFWDWYSADKTHRKKFVLDTYTCNYDVTIDGTHYVTEQAILPDEYATLAAKTSDYTADNGMVGKAASFFSPTNTISHDNGYVLTLDLSNPDRWNDHYTLSDGTGTIGTKAWKELSATDQARYTRSATFTCNESGTYGQYQFEKGAIVSQAVFDKQTTQTIGGAGSVSQATFVSTYVAKDDCEVGGQTMLKGNPISATDYAALSTTEQGLFEAAYICTTLTEVGPKDYRVLNDVIGKAEYDSYAGKPFQTNFQPAYYCTVKGSWGGKYYESGKTYQAIDYCQLLPTERENFDYNYDALDLLLNESALGRTEQQLITKIDVDGATAYNTNMAYYDKTGTTLYNREVPIDYIATYTDTPASAVNGDFYVRQSDNTYAQVSTLSPLDNTLYETLPNERSNYVSFAISGANIMDRDSDNNPVKGSNGKFNYAIYIVNTTFDVAGTMYNAGMTITKADYDKLHGTTMESYVTPLYFERDEANWTPRYYYCINEHVHGANDANVKDKNNQAVASDAISDINNVSYASGTTVPVGTIISQANFSDDSRFPNYQQDFSISGTVPVEEATLYVPVTADIKELTKDRYITVIYQYSYNESDDGQNFDNRIEKHIINLRLKFKSGQPTLGDLTPPALVLPLERVSIDNPYVQEGAFPVLGGGYELYANLSDAQAHRNGRPYVNNGEPLYFYQNNYYVAYYAETRMGRTYTDPVPLSIANYQRMADVITDPNHMFIDHKSLARNPRIYIDDRTVGTTGLNEFQSLQTLYDLAKGDFGNEEKNHGRDLTGLQNLDFFFQSDIDMTGETWTPLGSVSGDPCFGGNVHGMGYSIRNLDHSFIGSLCGNVYNLGVQGTFTGAGIADGGEGYVENCWTSSTGTPATGTPGVFHYTGSETVGKHLINSYYQDDDACDDDATTTAAYAAGGATPRHGNDFVNGLVAYDLNRFYLEGRYRLGAGIDDKVNSTDVVNQMFRRDADGAIVRHELLDENGDPVLDEDDNPVYVNTPFDVAYPADYAWHESDYNTTDYYGYVEKLYHNGDFRYADGLKPVTADQRETDDGFLPIFPDDYLFFGQKLSYDLYSSYDHDLYPTAAVKDHTVVGSTGTVDNTANGLLTSDEATTNRIYRAPAYFGNGTYGRSAIFNRTVALAATYQGTFTPHKGMTAIDFTAYGNGNSGSTNPENVYSAGPTYGPLSDYDYIDDIRISGLTRNLLAYAPLPDGSLSTSTGKVLKSYFNDPVFATTDDDYLTVDAENTSGIHGHLVQKTASGYVANNDHLLVDGQDFNCPIAYTFATDDSDPSKCYYMWFQRVPSAYVNSDNAGWQTIALPFTADLVTTQSKGELTHFYAGSTVGHEYWLRTLAGINTSDDTKALFACPAADTSADDKTVTNDFLWDYYYSVSSSQDKNTDTYQQDYYSDEREYEGYPLYAATTPYLIGYPGKRYYEFDLSGEFQPANTKTTISKLPKQTVTFVSVKGAAIGKSDSDYSAGAVKVTKGGKDYTFVPTYQTHAVGSTERCYLLDADGDAFSAATAGSSSAQPFTAYMTAPASSGSAPHRILIGYAGDQQPEEPMQGLLDRGLTIYGQKGAIVIESTLEYEATVVITTTSGQLIERVTVPAETRQVVPVAHRGIFIANRQKVAVM